MTTTITTTSVTHTDPDLELSPVTSQPDPYSLQARLIPPEQLTTLRQRGYRRKVRKFYEDQNANIERMLKSVDEHRLAADAEHEEKQLKVKIAVRGSFILNCVLAVLQTYGATSSLSYSLFATMADSIFDPFSNITLWLAHRTAKKIDERKYPAGKARMATVGNIIFSFIMMSVSLILIVESIREMATHKSSGDDVTDFHVPAIAAVSVAFLVKLCLFLYCWGLRQYSQVRILWEDHRNDLFINGFGIMTSVLGSKIAWWIDPMGATIIAFLIIGLWGHTAKRVLSLTSLIIEELQLLIGISADHTFLQQVTYIALTHDPKILQIDTCRAYHSGPGVIIEVDIVMDPNSTLRETHDVSQALQDKLELLPGVERCYIHCDFETEHKPEHRKKFL